MSNGNTRRKPYTDRQRFEAAGWFMDIHDADDPSPEMLLRWSQWLEASEGNRLAFEAAEQAWHAVPADADLTPARQADGFPRVQEENYDASMSVEQWRRGGRRVGRQTRSAPFSAGTAPLAGARQRAHKNGFRHAFRRFRLGAVAASLVLAVIAGGLVLERYDPLARPSSGEFITRTGEHRSLTLADGSRISMGARSRLSVEYTDTERRLRLTAGEAFFLVHKDPQRPFRVEAMDGVITAVGTAFNVRAIADHVTVAVTEGVVKVSDSSSAPAVESRSLSSAAGKDATRFTIAHPPQAIRLAAGDQLSYSRSNLRSAIATAKPTRIDSAQPTRWRDGWLVYRNEPLQDVIADVARYTDKKIHIDPAVSAGLHYTGVVSQDSVLEWIEALPGVFPVRIESRDEARELTVVDRPSPATKNIAGF